MVKTFSVVENDGLVWDYEHDLYLRFSTLSKTLGMSDGWWWIYVWV